MPGGPESDNNVRQYGAVRRLVLIGGGDLMAHAAESFRSAGYEVLAVLSQRHAEERMPIIGEITRDWYATHEFAVHVAATPDDFPEDPIWGSEAVMALCFGPAWIFPKATLELFGSGMANFNGIPVPRYLGGAHYTWQIMNGDRTGACVLQEITGSVDRGPILRYHHFDLPDSVRTPLDYMDANYSEGKSFIDALVRDFYANVAFQCADFAEVEGRRLYLPRLFTPENAWIDWSWRGEDIERFCNAFDVPYPGASTIYEEGVVRFSDIALEPDEAVFHPYQSGLVVRRLGDVTWVATTAGLLRIGAARDVHGNDLTGTIKEGRRFVTPPERLHLSRTYRPVY